MRDKLQFLNSIGITETALAKNIGVSKSAVHQWLHNEKNISKDSLLLIQEYLDWLFEELAEKFPEKFLDNNL